MADKPPSNAMADFRINQGIYWLKAHTSYSEEELQFLIDRINTQTEGDKQRYLDPDEIKKFVPSNYREEEIKGLLTKWVREDYRTIELSIPGDPASPSFMIVDDGDGRLEITDSRDTFFYSSQNEQGKSVWIEDAYVARLWSHLGTSEIPHHPPLARLHFQNIERVREAYFTACGHPDLFGFEEAAGFLDNLEKSFQNNTPKENLSEDYTFFAEWFLRNRLSWVKTGASPKVEETFSFRQGITLLVEMGHMGGAEYVLKALGELSSYEWQALFHNPEFSLELAAHIAEMGEENPRWLSNLSPKTAEGDLILTFGRMSQKTGFSPEELDQAVDRFCRVFGQNGHAGNAVTPGELFISLRGLKNLLGNNSGYVPGQKLVNCLYHFIGGFQTIPPDKIESLRIPGSLPNNLFDQERWDKARLMDLNLDILTEAFLVLDLAGLDGRQLEKQVNRVIAEDRDIHEPQDVLTALFMILNEPLPDVPRSQAYVQFYKRVIARQMLARRRGDEKLDRELEKLQTMNQIGRELERMFWGNKSFRESLLQGHEAELDRQFRDNLDSRDHILARNFLPLAVMEHLYRTYVADEKGEIKPEYREEGKSGELKAWAEIAFRMESGEINLGNIVETRLENAGYADLENGGFSRFLASGQETSAYQKILRWCEGQEDRLPFSVFWRQLNDRELGDYLIGGKDARAQGITAIFILRSWSSGVNGRIENYFDYLEGNGNSGKFTVTERLAFLEGFRHSDLKHLVPHYLSRFFKDPNELVRQKAFEIYAELGYPSAIARNFLGVLFDMNPDERRTPFAFMQALERVTIGTERNGGTLQEVSLNPETRMVIGDIAGFQNNQNDVFRFRGAKRRFKPEELKIPRHQHPPQNLFPMTESSFQGRLTRLQNPDDDHPFVYRRLSHRLVGTGDERVIPALVDVLMSDAPVKVEDRPLYPIMPALDTLLAIFGAGGREAVEQGLVRTMSHTPSPGPLAQVLPGLLLKWGRDNNVDVVTSFRKAIFQYDSGANLEIERLHQELDNEKGKTPWLVDQVRVEQLESDLIVLYAVELQRRARSHPEVLDQLIVSLYNEVRRQYLVEELKRFGIPAIRELTRRIEILSKKIDDPSLPPLEREDFQLQREKLLEVLLAIQ
ncbi:MAG: hypothetical protein HY541_04890 [Deltaproteobacteria bacterium]|nr:hypothetical protein [Deltaproteobacteria bacterium]